MHKNIKKFFGAQIRGWIWAHYTRAPPDGLCRNYRGRYVNVSRLTATPCAREIRSLSTVRPRYRRDCVTRPVLGPLQKCHWVSLRLSLRIVMRSLSTRGNTFSSKETRGRQGSGHAEGGLRPRMCKRKLLSNRISSSCYISVSATSGVEL